MLVRLFGKNFRSFKDPFELSLVAADLSSKEDVDRGIFEVPIQGMPEPLRLLRVVAIFGANGSGKSAILSAASALRWLALYSSRYSTPDANLPVYQPFLLSNDSSQKPVELGCDLVMERSLLRYKISFKADSIESEFLTLLDGEGEEIKLIDRQGNAKIGGSLITGKKSNRLYVKEMQPNVSVLSKLAQHGPQRGKESVQPYYRAIRDATLYADYSSAASNRWESLDYPHEARFADDSEYREWIMRHLIRPADVGIAEVKASREIVELPEAFREFIKANEQIPFPENQVVISFVHQGESNQSISFSEESAGTKKLFNIANSWWRLGHEPVSLFADELSASLHPRLLGQLIRVVNDVSSDRQSQLIFASHDMGLLEIQDGKPPALRRDQVYFTEKNVNGASELYALVEFKDQARSVHNIRKRYLSGLYGALPAVEKLDL